MRFFLPAATLLLSFASLAAADTITSGSIQLLNSQGAGSSGSYSFQLNTSLLALSFGGTNQSANVAPVMFPTCTPSNAAGTCAFDSSYSVTNLGSYFEDAFCGGSCSASTLTYNGTTYTAAGPIDFTLDLTFMPSTAPFASTTSTSDPDTNLNWSFTNLPFTVTGTATLVYGGQTIFSNMALDGSGTINGSGVRAISGPDVNSQSINNTFAFSSVPEPSAIVLGITGLGVLGITRRRRA